jgi:hypothetical protein
LTAQYFALLEIGVLAATFKLAIVPKLRVRASQCQTRQCFFHIFLGSLGWEYQKSAC